MQNSSENVNSNANQGSEISSACQANIQPLYYYYQTQSVHPQTLAPTFYALPQGVRQPMHIHAEEDVANRSQFFSESSQQVVSNMPPTYTEVQTVRPPTDDNTLQLPINQSQRFTECINNNVQKRVPSAIYVDRFEKPKSPYLWCNIPMNEREDYKRRMDQQEVFTRKQQLQNHSHNQYIYCNPRIQQRIYQMPAPSEYVKQPLLMQAQQPPYNTYLSRYSLQPSNYVEQYPQWTPYHSQPQLSPMIPQIAQMQAPRNLPVTAQMNLSANNTQPTRRRINFTTAQKEYFESIFRQNERPTHEELQDIADYLAIPFKSAKTWFQNRRTKANKAGNPMIELN